MLLTFGWDLETLTISHVILMLIEVCCNANDFDTSGIRLELGAVL
jgi:hypothetical protein